MNQQYQPTPQNFAQTRPSPVLSPQTQFQNVPLGPQKPPLNPPPQLNNSFQTAMGYNQNHTFNSAPNSQSNFSRAQTTAATVPPNNPPQNQYPPPPHQLPPQRQPPATQPSNPSLNQTFSHNLPPNLSGETGGHLISHDTSAKLAGISGQPPFLNKVQQEQVGPGVKNGAPGPDFGGHLNQQMKPPGPPQHTFNGQTPQYAPPITPNSTNFPPQMKPPAPIGPTNHTNQPPMPRPPQNMMPRNPNQYTGPSMSPAPGNVPPPGPPGSYMPQGPGSQFAGPPMPGQMPPPIVQNQGQFGQPPMPGNGPPPQFTQPPLPTQPPNSFGPAQLSNQMQGMNIGGPRVYPPAPGPLKSPGGTGMDGTLHMLPPLSMQQQQQQQQPQQQGYVNGQQMRSPQAPGYPPMASGPGGYGYGQQQQQQQQQQRRLDPDQMPSPIQVMQDDQQTRSGVFVTNQKGLVPPLVTTKFVVQDQGNCSPRYARATMYNVPITQDLMKQTAVPFGLVISPMARTTDGEYPPPIVNFGDLGPVRCIRCKAYICPYMQFIDAGRRFQCLFCKAATDVPSEYFQHLDHTGQRMDRFERPELVLGTYEFTATADYCRNSTVPKEPALIFVIDVSYNNIKSGLVHLLCSQMKEILNNLPVDQDREKSNMKIGFITYNSSVHFYNIKGTLAAPQMLVVGDTQEMFMPLLDGFLCTPEESGGVLDSLMQQIPAMFEDTRETETLLLPAILAGLEALKASDRVGKLLVFHSTLPTADAPGRLKNRDDRKLLGTDKEKTVLTPQTQAYNQLGQDCVQFGCSVDLFLFNNAYIDIATIGQVSRLTGGEVSKYTYFQADTDGGRLISDIITNISRPIAFDGVMRVRTSTGIRPTDFYGHCYMSNTTDIELASIDCDKAIAVEIKHDDKLSEEEGVYIQVALLYTSCSGQRRLRIMNLSLKTCSQMSDLYRSCDLDTIINFFSKQTTYKLLEASPKAIKDGIVARAAQILANYRKNCASPSSAGQLILPECMKLLPLYTNCLLKSDALSGGSDITVDDRSYVMQAVMTMDVPSSVAYFYPRLIPLHALKDDQDPVEIPPPIRCTIEKMSDQGVYLLENGMHMFLWVGLGASADFLERVFGVPTAAQVNVESVSLPVLDNPLSEAVRSVVEQVRAQRHRCMRLTMVRQREKREPVFKHFLVEDRGMDASPSYVDFLCHMHKEIRNILS